MKRVFLPADGRPAVHRFGYSAHVPLTSGSVRSVHVGCLFMSSPVYAQQLMKLSPPPPHPPPPNVISLPLPPPMTNPPNWEKIERFIGTPVRTPPGFMADRQCLSPGRE